MIKHSLAVLLMICMAQAQHEGPASAYGRAKLADAPSAVERQSDGLPRRKAGFWAWQNPGGGQGPLRTNREVWTSKSFWAANSAYLAAIVYDLEVTHQGLAHHVCVEGTGQNKHPSRGALYVGAVPEFAGSIVWGWLVSRYVWQPLVFQLPAIGSAAHIRAGTGWLTHCW